MSAIGAPAGPRLALAREQLCDHAVVVRLQQHRHAARQVGAVVDVVGVEVRDEVAGLDGVALAHQPLGHDAFDVRRAELGHEADDV